jgi:plastocyanin
LKARSRRSRSRLRRRAPRPNLGGSTRVTLRTAVLSFVYSIRLAPEDCANRLPTISSMTAPRRCCLAAFAPVVVAMVVFGSASVDASDQAVKIVDFGYSPGSVAIKAGETVTWTNTGNRTHTVTGDDSGFDSGSLSTSDAFSNIFDTPGTYPYHCVIHPNRMNGTVIVTAAERTLIPSGSPPRTPPLGTLPPSFFASGKPSIPSISPALVVPTPVASPVPTEIPQTSGATPAFLIVGALLAAAVGVGLAVRARGRSP